MLRRCTLVAVFLLLTACGGDDGGSAGGGGGDNSSSEDDGRSACAEELGIDEDLLPPSDGSGEWATDVDDGLSHEFRDVYSRLDTDIVGLLTDDLDALGDGDRASTGTNLTPEQIQTYLDSAEFDEAVTAYGGCSQFAETFWTNRLERAANGGNDFG